MKIEVGKKYRTRDGLRVFGPMEPHLNGNPRYRFKAPPNGSTAWCYFGEDGEFWGTVGEEDEWDLVEEVTDDRADNASPAVVPGHDTSAGDRHYDGTGSECLEVPVLERRTEGLWPRLVSRLAAIPGMVRRLCGVATLRDRDDHDLSQR